MSEKVKINLVDQKTGTIFAENNNIMNRRNIIVENIKTTNMWIERTAGKDCKCVGFCRDIIN